MNIQLQKFIRETIEPLNNIQQPEYYLDDFYAMDYNDEVDENSALQYIQSVINQVKNLKFPHLLIYL